MNDKARKIYHSIHGRFILIAVILIAVLYLCLALFALILILTQRNTYAFTVLGLLLILLFVMICSFVYARNKIFLIISPEGLEYHNIGYRIFASWSDVERIGLKSGGLIPVKGLMLEGLFLQRATFQGIRWMAWPWHESFIPLAQFMDWQRGDLREAIEQFAPHLFTEPAPVSTPQTLGRQTHYTYARDLLFLQATIIPLFLFIAGIMIYLTDTPAHRFIWVVYGVLMSFVGGLNIYQSRRIRLVTSSEGIEYYASGYDLRTTWDNIERIGFQKLPLFPKSKRFTIAAPAEGLILREPAQIHIQKWMRWSIGGNWHEHFIPLTLFTHWRYGELGNSLRFHAPHLFKQK